MKPVCIFLAGPTAVGKTALSIQLAERLNTSILSSDSRQCYKELNIGVAKPEAEFLGRVPHYFIDSHSIHDSLSAADFEAYALDVLNTHFAQKPVMLVTGGTGLYFRALERGLDAIPEVPGPIRDEIETSFTQGGLEWLQKAVQQEDPTYFASGEIQNPRRLMRALEVVRTSGQSIIHFQTALHKERPFRVVKMALDLPRHELYQRIHQRTDQMMAQGLLTEARGLYEHRHLNALQTVGYRELFDYLHEYPQGFTPAALQDAVEKIKQNTRHYAKRQITWFRHDGYTWFPPSLDAVWPFLEQELSRPSSD